MIRVSPTSAERAAMSHSHTSAPREHADGRTSSHGRVAGGRVFILSGPSERLRIAPPQERVHSPAIRSVAITWPPLSSARRTPPIIPCRSTPATPRGGAARTAWHRRQRPLTPSGKAIEACRVDRPWRADASRATMSSARRGGVSASSPAPHDARRTRRRAFSLDGSVISAYNLYARVSLKG